MTTHPSVAGLRRLPRPVAWVFTGGGARCAAQTGMAEVLGEQGLRADLLVGAGGGALTAAGLAGPDPDLRRVRETWRRLSSESVLSSLGTAAVRAFSTRRTGRSWREFRDMVSGVVPGDPPIPAGLSLVASDLVSGRPIVLTDGPIGDAIATSACLPLVFQPVAVGDHLLVDGSLTAAAPLDQARAAGAASVVLLDTGAASVPEDSVPDLRWWQVAALAYGHQIRSQLAHALMRTAPLLPVVTVSTAAGGYLDYTDPDSHFAAGRSAASAALADGVGRGAAAPGLHGVPVDLAEDPRLVDLLR